MHSENSHTFFKTLSGPDKLVWIMSLTDNGSNAQSTKTVLRTIFEDKAEDFYIRKQALALLVRFLLQKQIRVEALVDLLLDVDLHENDFIILSSIQFSTKLFRINQEGFLEWLQTMAHHPNSEIRSEAFSALGKMYLFRAFYPTSSVEYIKDLVKAKEKFELAEAEIENRIDAVLFKSISTLLLSIQADEKVKVEEAHSSIKQYLWKYIRLNTRTEETVFFVNLFHPLSVLVNLYRHSPNNWIDFKTELNAFLINYLEFDLKLSCESLFTQTFLDDYGTFLKNQVVDELMVDRFQTELFRLKRVKEEKLLENDLQVALVDEIIEKIVVPDKKKDAVDNIALLARIHAALPSVDVSQLSQALAGIDVHNPFAFSQLLFDYLAQFYPGRTLQTGYSQGELILSDISKVIQEHLPLYPDAKFQEFILVLSDLINYFILTQRGGKDRFPYLFKDDAKEKDLQDDLLSRLQSSERAEYYLPEVKEIADGGRVDIIYHRDAIQLPIEIKRSFVKPNWEVIRANYLSQAQTYARTRDQLAFFVVLDLSAKAVGKPIPNTRDLYKVFHLDTESDLDIAYPDYVIAFIIPGNKPLPSERSSYK